MSEEIKTTGQDTIEEVVEKPKKKKVVSIKEKAKKKAKESIERAAITMYEKVDKDNIAESIREYYTTQITDPIVADRWKQKILNHDVVDLTSEVMDYLQKDYPDITEEDVEEAFKELVVNNELDKEIPSGWEKIIAAFNEYCYEDEEFVAETCSSAATVLYDQFRIAMDDPKDPIRNGYKIVAMVFITTYEEIVRLLIGKREKHPTYMINIANRLEVGYSNNNSDDDEKVGNIMIYLRNLDHTSTPSDDYESKMTGSSKEYITNWNQENMVYNPDDTARIAANAKKRLEKLDIRLGTDECIFPIFVTVYELIIDNIKIKRREEHVDMKRVNWCNCFTIKCLEQDTGIDKITLIPSIEGKTDLKSDKYATSIYE